MKYKLIGDIHGKYEIYKDVIRHSKHPTIQVGDFGRGFYPFKDKRVEEFMSEMPLSHRFIRGNHDAPKDCKKSAFWIPDGTIENNMMFTGGAWSIDYAWRVKDRDWWADEELSYTELEQQVELYATAKPDIMITHDCPASVAKQLFVDEDRTIHKSALIKTRTGQAYEAMFKIHKPKIWVFGHWHYTLHETIKGTQFVCLNEFDTAILDTEKVTIEVEQIG